MEIGSEFSLRKPSLHAQGGCVPAQLRLGKDRCITWLGRTAIDLVLEDILSTRVVRTVYMPSYCCDSMIAPFVQHGLIVQTYPVNFGQELEVEPDINVDCDIFFSMNYFGAPLPSVQIALDAFRAKGAVIIEDITHSLFSPMPCHHGVDYAVASLRKWIETPAGGIAIKWYGKFLVRAEGKPPESAVAIRMEAMREKRDYLDGKPVDKASFLGKYAQFNADLEENYQSKAADEHTLQILAAYDFASMLQRRRENAQYLRDALRACEALRVLVPLQADDGPLFVPIVVVDGSRDALHRMLVENQIYCPRHWSAPAMAQSDIYEREISLICDQRYDRTDMERIVGCIKNMYDGDESCGHLL